MRELRKEGGTLPRAVPGQLAARAPFWLPTNPLPALGRGSQGENTAPVDVNLCLPCFHFLVA